MWSRFNFLQVGIYFDGLRCEFSSKNKFKILVLYLPIFVADTKIIFGYDFVAPLKLFLLIETGVQRNT